MEPLDEKSFPLLRWNIDRIRFRTVFARLLSHLCDIRVIASTVCYRGSRSRSLFGLVLPNEAWWNARSSLAASEAYPTFACLLIKRLPSGACRIPVLPVNRKTVP
jgi:hypothetical protein